MAFQKPTLEVRPSAFGANRHEHTARSRCGNGRRHAVCRARISENPNALTDRPKLVLHVHLQLSMDTHRGKPCVTRLLESFEEQRTVDVALQYVRVEVVTFDTCCVGEGDVANAQGGELRPESTQDLWPGERQQHIDTGPVRSIAFEGAVQDNPVIVEITDGADAEGTVDDADPYRTAGCRSEYRTHVRGLHAPEDRTAIHHLAWLEQNQIHSRCN